MFTCSLSLSLSLSLSIYIYIYISSAMEEGMSGAAKNKCVERSIKAEVSTTSNNWCSVLAYSISGVLF